MSTTTPEIYFDNILRYCDEGITDRYGNFRLGGGTVIATHASGFDAASDISARRFVWDSNTPTVDINIATDINTAAMTTTYEGGTLRFITSGRRYKVTTISPGSKYFELETTPNPNDEDDEFEYLVGVHHSDYQGRWENDVTNFPATNMHDEFLHTIAKDISTASTKTIKIFLPNMLKDASFGGAAVGTSFVVEEWYNSGSGDDWAKSTANNTHGNTSLQYVNTAALAERTTLDVPSAAGLTGGTYFNLWAALDTTAYYVWYTKDGAGSDPAPGGKTGIGPVPVSTGDSSTVTALLTSAFIDAIGDFGAFPSASIVTVTNADLGITTDAVDVDSGVSVNVFQQGTSTSSNATQFAKFEIKKGTTYILQFYVRSVTADTDADALSVNFSEWGDPAYTAALNGAAVDASVGTGGNLKVTPTSAGVFITQEYTADRDAPGFQLSFFMDPLLLGSATKVDIELAYLWEKKEIDTLIIGNTPPGVGWDIDVVEFPSIDLLNGTNPGSTATLLSNFKPKENNEVKALDSTSSGPCWRINIQATSAQEIHIGQLWLTKKFDLERSVQSPHDPDMRRVQFKQNVALSGAKHHITDFEERVVNGETRIFTTAQMDLWVDWWNTVGKNFRSFWYRHTSTGDLLFMVNDKSDFERSYNGAIRGINFQFKEQK